jgi:cysteine-rich repeat protein
MSDASGWDQPEHYLTMRMGDVNGDGLTDLCARGGNSLYCWHSTGTGFGSSYAGPAWSDAAGFTAAKYYTTFRLLDVDGDGDQDACIRSSTGMLCAPSLGGSFGPAFNGPAWSDASGYNQPDNYLTIRSGDFTGDGRDDLCIRANGGMRCFASTGTGFGPSISGPTWDDASGFAGADQYSTIRMADVNGDGLADLCARTSAGFRCHLSDGAGFGPEHTGPNWSDASGWSDADNYGTLQLGDVDGDGDLDVCARANANVLCALWDGDGHDVSVTGPDWSDTRGYAYPDHWRTMRLADVTGDGRDDLCIRSGSGFQCAPSLGASFGATMAANSWSDTNDWFQPEQHTAIVTGSSSCPDHDRDGTSDCQDACDDDPAKVDAGVCGCGVPDDDRDGDGWLDCEELCDDDGAKVDPGQCGCGLSDVDADADLWADCVDACPVDAHKQDPGACGCGASDADTNGNGAPDCLDCGDGLLDAPETCDDGGRVSGDGCSDVCQLEALTVGAWVPGRAGVVNTITVRGASPGAQVVLLAGVTLGSAPVPGCPGVTIPLRTPRVLSASNADIAGTTTTSLQTPAGLAGATAAYVAVERATCRVSAMESQGL